MSRRDHLPYPRLDEDQQLRMEQERAKRAREQLDPSDVLAVTQHLLLEIADDTQPPMYPLVEACTRVRTATETGKTPHLAELVGAALLPRVAGNLVRTYTLSHKC